MKSLVVHIFCLVIGVNAGIIKRQADFKMIGLIPETSACMTGVNEKYSEQTCYAEQNMCMTQIILSEGTTSVVKSCQKPEVCTTQEENNYIQCSGFDPLTTEVSTCTLCCVGDFCNDASDVTQIEEIYDVISSINVSPVL